MKTWRAVILAAAMVAFCAPATGVHAEEAVTFEVYAVAEHPGPNTRAYLGIQADADGKLGSTLLVEPPLLGSGAIRFVALDYDEEQHPYILITLTASGTKRFEQITQDAVGKQIGFVIGGQLYSMPRVSGANHAGKIAISGSFTARQAANLVERLNAALPGRSTGR